MNEKPNSTSLMVGVALAVIGWLFSAVGIYVALNARVTALEVHSERLPVMEAKLDRLIERRP
jgi:hypothetical protein